MVMIYFQDHHLLFTMRTDQRIIAKRRKDRSTPPVKTTESMPFFFRNSEMEFFINGTMSGIKAAITDHLEMFFRDVPDKAFDKIHDRNGFLNVFDHLRDGCNGNVTCSPSPHHSCRPWMWQ